jgi:hypothetical protein
MIAEASLDKNGALALAKSNKPGVLGGYTLNHLTSFAIVSGGQYPAPRPDRIWGQEPATQAEDTTLVSVVRPPWWQIAAWSDRPGEFMTTSIRVSCPADKKLRQSAELAVSLRRSRTATVPGAKVQLAVLSSADQSLSPWKRFAKAFQPVDLRLVQTLVPFTVAHNDVRLFVVTDQAVQASVPTSMEAATNPAFINGDEAPLPTLYLIAGKDWYTAQNADISYAIRMETGSDHAEVAASETAPTAQIESKLQEFLTPSAKTLFKVERGDGTSKQSISKAIQPASDEVTYCLVRYTVTPAADGQSTLKREPVASIKVAKVPPQSRIRPLKTAVAVLKYSKPDGTDVTLAGYGQLGPEFPIFPSITGAADLTIEWQRIMNIRVIRRNPGPGDAYQAVVTGPGGETYPFVADAPADGGV